MAVLQVLHRSSYTISFFLQSPPFSVLHIRQSGFSHLILSVLLVAINASLCFGPGLSTTRIFISFEPSIAFSTIFFTSSLGVASKMITPSTFVSSSLVGAFLNLCQFVRFSSFSLSRSFLL